MPSDNEYADAIEHELEVMGSGFSTDDRRKIAELSRLLPTFRGGGATKADRASARRFLPPSAFNMLKLRRKH